MPNVELINFPTDLELAQGAADAWLTAVEATDRPDQPLHVALSGGRIARHFFAAVANGAQARSVALGRVHFFWADERCVPPDDPESNFGLANRCLFQPLKIGPERIHRIRGEDEPTAAARAAADEMLRVVAPGTAGWPVLDLIFLGMGEDGHVASLFPGAPEEQIHTRRVFFPVQASKPPPHRITLSFGMISAARDVWVLASGAGKEAALRTSLTTADGTPLARVLNSRSHTKILTDIHLA